MVGYNTRFVGQFTLTPPLTLEQHNKLEAFTQARHKTPEFPFVYCGWQPAGDGRALLIESDGSHYEFDKWLPILQTRFFEKWGVTVSGQVAWYGEEADDQGVLYADSGRFEAVKNVIVNPGPSWQRKDESDISPENPRRDLANLPSNENPLFLPWRKDAKLANHLRDIFGAIVIMAYHNRIIDGSIIADMVLARVNGYEALVNALEFYADPAVYEPDVMNADPINGLTSDYVKEPDIMDDAGANARVALAIVQKH